MWLVTVGSFISAALKIEYWEPDKYAEDPPFSIIRIDDIKSHVGRQYLDIDGARVWTTIPIDAVCVFLIVHCFDVDEVHGIF